MLKTQRLTAALIRTVLSGTSLTVALQVAWRDHPTLSAQQRGAIQDIGYGVLRFLGEIDALLARLLKKPPHDEMLLCLLRVALYQLRYSRSAAHAVVDHAVAAAKQMPDSRGGASLVNAVLRNFLRQQEALLAQIKNDEVARYSHPQWWIAKLKAQYPQDYAAILNANNGRPPMTLRVNRRQISASDYQKKLADENIAAQPVSGAVNETALLLAQPVLVEKLPGFAAGWVSVQDVGAQCAAPLLDVQDGMRVLDACAAPGGKSAHLLETAEVDLTALDVDAGRLARVEQNFARLHLEARRVVCGDASQLESWWDGKPFERILADVPCSASGVVRRHPDIKWLRRERDIAQFAARQGEILDTLWQTLAGGGKLLYATCSVFDEENTLRVENFLQQHADARRLPLALSDITHTDGQLLPDPQHDGFYYALLQKQ